MANPKQLGILRKGVKEWNKWRDEKPKVAPDLRDADLRDANLNRADLHRADLHRANLHRAKLIEATLIWADLSDADLRDANLRDANLNRADLHRANLSGANLHRAKLIEANFIWANLSEATFSEATFGSGVFANCDLSECIGLEEAGHLGRSYIDIATIYRSKGKIPHKFLRKAGVPENFIEFMGSLTGTAYEYYSCFISYSTKDDGIAKRLYADLQTQGVRCWFAPEDFKIGQKIRPGIDEAIRIHDKLLLVLSERSVKSSWVEKEVETAFEKERKEDKTVLFPVRLDEAVFQTEVAWAADIRRTRHIGDFSKWKDHDSYKKSFDRLLRDLKAGDKKE